MQYQMVIKMFVWRLIGVILSLNSRCIKGTFSLYNYIYMFVDCREYENDESKKQL